ncbi:hypothetical protein CAMSH0001_1184 [Campylobacter showae RM3277]|uniref:Uncharacterized protein n=1 Tax=Campylobacter showae RM3277 TaxID=553219 RepID=C6RDM7_9BACT|nr:hypothetical protein CAMSH0001_1184 [Campylobacter showae RM3277]
MLLRAGRKFDHKFEGGFGFENFRRANGFSNLNRSKFERLYFVHKSAQI